MGGLLLAKFGCVRYLKEDYIKTETSIVHELSSLLNTTIYSTRAIRNKDSFGNMDLLVFRHNELNGEKLKETISKLEGCVIESFHLNGNVLSFAYKPVFKSDNEKIRVDLILVEPENWDTSKVFFNYGELGNLIGKLYYRFGLRYGFTGLNYDVFIGELKIGRIKVSKNPESIFSFLGLSYDRYCQGFGSIEEVFDYIIDSTYFRKDIFYFENLNHTNKNRNKGRPNYSYFLEYIKDAKDKAAPFVEDKTKYWESIKTHFDDIDFNASMLNVFKDYKIQKDISSKWSGKWVMDTFDVKGKELGLLIKDYITSKDDFNNFILNNTEKLIREDFTQFYNNLNK